VEFTLILWRKMQTSPPPLRQRTIEIARKVCEAKPVYVDTETTGLERTDEIVEISIVDHDGHVLLETLVKPSRSIPYAATRIHGITDEEVIKAPTWPAIWPTVRGHLFGRLIVFYNAEFDLRMMQQSHARYKQPWKENFNTFDLLKLYAEYRGEWDNHRRAYRYISLAEAGRQCNISLPNAHRSTADTLLTRALLLHLAESQ
jgi:DNA polymerase III subunit epsilon